jgi:hypothetical protein
LFFRVTAYLLCIAGILFYLDRSALLGDQATWWGLMLMFTGFIFFFASYILYFLMRSRHRQKDT